MDAPVSSDGAADVFSMGPGTLSISRRVMHFTIRQRFLSAMRAAVPNEAERGIAVLQGGAHAPQIYSTDGEDLFRQESYFFYLFGVQYEGWYGTIDIRTGCSTLFMPRLPEEHAVWMGEQKSPNYYQAMYGVDHVRWTDGLGMYLATAKPPCLHVLKGTNTDSGCDVDGPVLSGLSTGVDGVYAIESSTLFDVLTECRVFKTPEELSIIRYANALGSRAFVDVMQKCRPGMMEYHYESTYLFYCYSKGGSRRTLYNPIAGSGPNAAVLHYGHSGAPNDRQVCDGDMVLLDFGCEYYHYGSDITCSFPANGRFTDRQRAIYVPVLEALQAVTASLKPGVSWVDMHTLALRTILQGLRVAGVCRGEVDALMDADIGALFMPHGLGHFLGLDTHDVGGYSSTAPPRSQRPGYKRLRTARVLKEGMVVTVEPGCYFIASVLKPALEDPAKRDFLDAETIREYAGFGGVRLEDNVLITATGSETFTNVPRKLEDVESVMAGGAWPEDV